MNRVYISMAVVMPIVLPIWFLCFSSCACVCACAFVSSPLCLLAGVRDKKIPRIYFHKLQQQQQRKLQQELLTIS